MKGNGVEVQIKGTAPAEAKASHSIKPKPKHLRVADGIDPATVSGEKGALGRTVDSSKKGEAFVEHIAHHMRVAGVAKEFQSKERTHSMTGRDHLRAWKASFLEQLIEGDLSHIGQKEEKASKAGSKPARSEVQLADIGNRSRFRANARGRSSSRRRGSRARTDRPQVG
jgi:hypothetical protein